MDGKVYRKFDAMTSRFYGDFGRFMEDYDWEDLRRFDPYEWVDSKTEWS